VVGGAGDWCGRSGRNGIVERGVLSTSIGTSGVMFVHSDDVKMIPKGAFTRSATRYTANGT